MMPAMQDTAVHLSDRHFRTIAELIEGKVASSCRKASG